MLRILLRQARPGMILARQVAHPRDGDSADGSAELLPRATVLTAPDIARLHEAGVYDLWVDLPELAILDELYSPNLCPTQQRLCEGLRVGFAEQAARVMADHPSLSLERRRDAVSALVRVLLTMPAAGGGGGPLGSLVADEHLLRHGAEVAYLAILLGVYLETYVVEQRRRVTGRQAKDMANLGVGCLFHDLGETVLPEQHRESRRDAEDAAWGVAAEWRRHVDLGFQLVRSHLEPSAAAVVLHHHQHFDGSGFPGVAAIDRPQCETQIHIFSRIAAAADSFVHFLQDGGCPMPPVHALWKIQQKPYANWLDPVVRAALLAVVPPFAPGTLVELSDRRHAVVTRLNPDTPCYPEVQVIDPTIALADPIPTPVGEPAPQNAPTPIRPPEVIDLARQPTLHIQTVDGVKVRPYLYGPQSAPTRAVA